MYQAFKRTGIACALTLAGLVGIQTAQAEEKAIEVAASTAIVADWVKAVGGDHVEVHTLIESGSDPHTYQPSPKDVAKLQKQAAIFLIGHGLEQPLEAVLDGYKGPKVAIAEEIAEHDDDHDDHGHEKHDDHGHHGQKHDDHGHEKHEDHGHEKTTKITKDMITQSMMTMKEHAHGGGGIEWAGAFTLEAGSYVWSFEKVDGAYADPAMKMAFIASSGDHPIEAVELKAAELFKAEGKAIKAGGTLSAGTLFSVQFAADKDITTFQVDIAEKGTYVFFCEHMPYEFEATQHFFKTAKGDDVEPVAEVPEGGHEHGHDDHGHDDHGHDKHDDHDDHGHDDHHGHHHGEHDPHIWLDVQKARAAIHLIEEELSKLHPEDAKVFAENAEQYEAKLDELEGWIKASVATIPEANRILITGHNAFGHFAEAYGFRNLGSINPSGTTAHISPDPKHLSELAKAAKAAKVPAVFPETGHSPRLIKALAREAGITVAPALTVDNLGEGEAGTYLGFMHQNTEIIVEALGGKLVEGDHEDHDEHKHDDHDHDHKHHDH